MSVVTPGVCTRASGARPKGYGTTTLRVITCSEVATGVCPLHEVHPVPRRVFNLYPSLKADQIVGRSLASGLLTEDEVPELVHAFRPTFRPDRRLKCAQARLRLQPRSEIL